MSLLLFNCCVTQKVKDLSILTYSSKGQVGNAHKASKIHTQEMAAKAQGSSAKWRWYSAKPLAGSSAETRNSTEKTA